MKITEKWQKKVTWEKMKEKKMKKEMKNKGKENVQENEWMKDLKK